MKIYTKEELTGMAVMLLVIYAIAFCSGFGYSLDLTRGDLDSIVSDHNKVYEQLKESNRGYINQTRKQCKYIMDARDKKCSKQIELAYQLGMQGIKIKL